MYSLQRGVREKKVNPKTYSDIILTKMALNRAHTSAKVADVTVTVKQTSCNASSHAEYGGTPT